ncbi:hypothetical protein WR30_23805 [Burkholderia contaminans FFH2055]|uniref:Uncharacterized protein n=1 Tax=Burkholderia contaminans TaxID=488447 RepID=A0A3N8S4P0_9BURK|nr:hypothetical protein WR30_23805 [Burkholderia contaminans FFH2055]RQT35013.1 hypothetical protein DF037_06690 [Burkholderia contaminans]RQT39276.1 hypothetical protein DF036_04345 [Burkholderia contaminans]
MSLLQQGWTCFVGTIGSAMDQRETRARGCIGAQAAAAACIRLSQSGQRNEAWHVSHADLSRFE